jgi:acylphosphatase
MNKAVKTIIHGHVQGVCYRHWAVQNATQLNLDGWVRNRADGTVEAIFVGKIEDVDEMINRAQHGPSGAKVDKIDVKEALGIVATGFTQKPTVDINQRRGH